MTTNVRKLVAAATLTMFGLVPAFEAVHATSPPGTVEAAATADDDDDDGDNTGLWGLLGLAGLLGLLGLSKRRSQYPVTTSVTPAAPPTAYGATGVDDTV